MNVKRSNARTYPSPEGGGCTRAKRAAGWGLSLIAMQSPPGLARLSPPLGHPPRTGRDKARLLLALCLLFGLATQAPAQDTYPSRPITLIVPYAAGGSIDLVARILAEGLTARLGQTVVVDDRPGGNGVLGIGAAREAKPDGHTPQMGSAGAHVTPAAVQKASPPAPRRG